MPLTPAGPLALARTRFATLLSNCSTWQTWCGEATAAAALNHIHQTSKSLGATDITAGEAAALVLHGDDFSRDAMAGSGPFDFDDRGEVRVRFIGVPPADYADDLEETEIWFLNYVGQVLDNLAALAGTGTYLPLRGMRQESRPVVTGKDDPAEGVAVRQTWAFRYGWVD